MFILFGTKQTTLLPHGKKKTGDHALVALALLIAQSDPKEKEQMIALVTQLLV